MDLNKLLNHFNFNNQEFNFQFQSHPHYPSALAFSDTLNFLGIKNDAYELDKEFWEELSDEFITIYNSSFTLIRKDKIGYIAFSDKEEKISKTHLLKNAENFVLLFEKTEYKQEKGKLHFSYFLYAFLGVVVFHSIWMQTWGSVIFNLLSIFGFYISFEIFNKKSGKESVVLNNFCGSSAKNSTQTNCTKIIDSDKINILGLKLSDFSLVYFSALLIVGLFFPSTSGVLKIVSGLSILIIGYSLFVQVFVEKTLCSICLFIIAILVGQITISVLFFNNEFSVNTFLLSVIAFFVAFFGLVFINDLVAQKDKYRKSDIKNLKFKRNYKIFKRELFSEEKINFRNTDVFKLGKPTAKLHISLVSNPYCGYCKDAHKIIEKLLESYPKDISAQIRFNYFEPDKNDEKLTNLMSDFLHTYKTKGEEIFLESVEYWFEKRIHQKLESIAEDLSDVIKTAVENINLGFTFTPIFFINGYQFPRDYDREDIFYFIEELLEDENIANEK
ncbi:thioredoxin domain-containing protein [Chryseobacterium gambrini]|uniref:thioredoxin domain-containing protein n=1 Tax=Chryseobacterium gambrini TaxID=373672 RepID=UPI0025B32811|nr:thioredoxin domain-containing protein [Chryseobacterium gambrini]MDN4028698.1 thioredoxin domain-containing protein [Chryseobacterium gambrini]